VEQTQKKIKEEWWAKTASASDAVGHGLTEEEYTRLLDLLGREVNMVELGICSALYSEHCSYKSTKIHLRNLPTTGPRVIQGPGENAGVVDIGDGEAVVFKVESHNHPSFIEPYQGAATGVGGILRDVFTMGARPIALMNALRFGSVALPKSRYLLQRAVKGIGTYGNCMGIPTVGGELFFHSAYDGNCLVNAFALGVVEAKKVFLGHAAGVGNAIFYVGSKTGRDGIHGATMASEEFNDDSEQKRPTVQVGDPFQEKLLLEACLEVMATGAVVGIQDMGAAGMTSSTYEMAERAESGVRIHLERVPQRETGMTPYEIMLSESQERMLVVVEAGREAEIEKIFAHWELDAVKIGEVIEGREVELLWHGELISSLDASLLTRSVPQYRWPEQEPAEFKDRLKFSIDELEEPQDLAASWRKLLKHENFCSRRAVYEQYDSTVGTNTVVHPGGDAAVVRVKSRGSIEKGIAMSLDCNSSYCAAHPRLGASNAVVEGFRNLTSVGAEPIGMSDCLNFGSPEKPEGMWQIAESIRGLSEACQALEIPVVSGNVSLYNETRGTAVLPTPMVAVVGLLKDIKKTAKIAFKQTGDVIFVVGDMPNDTLGASAYLSIEFGVERGSPPEVNYQEELRVAKVVRALISNQLLSSCHDISSGGLAAALAESCFSATTPLGARVAPVGELRRRDLFLFSESGPRYLISCSKEQSAKVKAELEREKIEICAIGEVGGDSISVDSVASIPLQDSYQDWSQALEELF